MPVNSQHYHPFWSDQIRPEVLRRFHRKCAVCGARNKSYIIRSKSDGVVEVPDYLTHKDLYEGHKVVRIILTVAHLNHFTWDNRPENLSLLCQFHHLQHDRAHKVEMRNSHPLQSVGTILDTLRSPNGRFITPIAAAKLRAIHRQIAHTKALRDRHLQSFGAGKYHAEMSYHLAQLTEQYDVLNATLLQVFRDCWAHPDPSTLIDSYVHWDSALKGSPSTSSIHS